MTDLMVTPDFTRLVAAGMYDAPGPNPQDSSTPPGSGPGGGTATANKSSSETRIIIYDLATKQPETCVHPPSPVRGRGECSSDWLCSSCRSIRLEGELTSVKISPDSQFALINTASENGPTAVRVRRLAPVRACSRAAALAGDQAVRSEHATGRAQVLRPQSVEACHPELFWRRRGQLRRQWERRCVSSSLALFTLVVGPRAD